jgi:hypothetical protein
MAIDPEVFRRGIFNLRTRRFGKVPELLIRKLLQYGAGRNRFMTYTTTN